MSIDVKEKKQNEELTISEVISYLENLNITFNKCSKEEVEQYFRTNKDYAYVILYRRIFKRYSYGEGKKGKYKDLDCAYLIDLCEIDSILKDILKIMTDEIEQELKIRIRENIEAINGVNSLQIVNKFLATDFNSEEFPMQMHKSILRQKGDIYHKDIFDKYHISEGELIENLPLGDFMRLASFGDLIRLYAQVTSDYKLDDEQLICVFVEAKKLRNALAHGSCLLPFIKIRDNYNKSSDLVSDFLGKCGIGVRSRESKLKNSVIRQVTYVFYLFCTIVKNKDVKQKVGRKLKDLFYKRMLINKEYYVNNYYLISVYDFFEKIIKKIF